MTLANLANILWLYAWLYEYIGLSLVLILAIGVHGFLNRANGPHIKYREY